jgi:molybdopterin synthase catalytic subunit
MFRIVHEVIHPDALHDSVLQDYNGAVVTFSGVVRNHSGSTKTAHLIYEAYAQMAERVMAEIGSEAMTKWGVDDVAVLHRVGQVEIGEISVLISVGSPHRGEAFKSCNYIIDQLKERVPIWKKEVGEDGAYWVEGPRAALAGD